MNEIDLGILRELDEQESKQKELEIFNKIFSLLSKHLGSADGAKMWLNSTGTGYETTAMDVIKRGNAKIVLAHLESQWSKGPNYA